ncbi:S-layer homology domain-containing protein [Paenibacillus sp. UNCCL117]|uniref:S-layer homology domain-containing protein n=1 Tax=unclassified Paenibacillus TaxID=185978 RepID=UPI00088A3D64|nr:MULTISPECIES: S-layer homology domain-containing protein [unclassified Paenibacillus]SDC93330.1 S-layer homology domain-containing protein [Paenibacillus sp. cl123]SFW29533.1 S-layer homology domain-containing protein [Paenibacillus sp. UNCCL117]
MGKERCSLVVVAALLGGLLIPSSSSAAEGSIRLIPEAGRIANGTEVTIRITAEQVRDLYGIQFRLQADPDIWRYEKHAISGRYTEFASPQQSGETGDRAFALIRRNIGDISEQASAEIASITYRARIPGVSEIRLHDVLAVSSETYINEHGKKDLSVLPLSVSQSVKIEVSAAGDVEPPSPAPGSAAPSPIGPSRFDSELQRLTGLLSDREQALALARQLIRRTELAAAAGEENGRRIGTLDSGELADRLRQLQQLQRLLRQNGLTVPLSVTVPMEQGSFAEVRLTAADWQLLSDAGVDLLLAAGQMDLRVPAGSFRAREGEEIAWTAEPISAAAAAGSGDASADYMPLTAYRLEAEAIGADGNRKKIAGFDKPVGLELRYKPGAGREELLGLYTREDRADNWTYIPAGKQDTGSGSFTAELEHFSEYAVIEYAKRYSDTADVYAEARKAIEVLTARHVIEGVDAERFAPRQAVTRAEFTALLVRSLQLPLPEMAAAGFADAEPDKWYTRYIRSAFEAGLIEGDAEGRMNPEAPITREQLAVMAARARSLMPEQSRSPEAAYTPYADDAQISGWARSAVYEAQASGLLVGMEQSRFAPLAETTRADAAVFLLRLAK